MSIVSKNLNRIRASIPSDVTLVAVSKTHPIEAIQEAYDAEQRIFGENRVQELVPKFEGMPKDIQWHLIGTLQRNKVKYIAPFVSMIHSVDNLELLKEINKEAKKNQRIIDCLIQVFIATEETKHGFSFEEAEAFFKSEYSTQFEHVRICGLMGMASFTEDQQQVKREFESLARFREKIQTNHSIQLPVLSMGMSGDYQLAIACGSNMVRVGSSIFGSRSYNQ